MEWLLLVLPTGASMDEMTAAATTDYNVSHGQWWSLLLMLVTEGLVVGGKVSRTLTT